MVGQNGVGRTVVVTGGSKGIGRAIVSRFADLGDTVYAVGRDEAALEKLRDETAGDVHGEICDLTDEGAVSALFKRIGDVDVLVNNAGTSESAPLKRTTLESWQLHLATNATSAFLCTRAVLPGMAGRDSGCVVTVASTAAKVGYPYTSAYTASKHAVLGLMRAVATEVAGTGVWAAAVCPAFVRTEMTVRSIERIQAKTGRSAADAEKALAKSSPLGRLLEPDEVGSAVEFLAAPGSATLNGQALVLDGGGIQA